MVDNIVRVGCITIVPHGATAHCIRTVYIITMSHDISLVDRHGQILGEGLRLLLPSLIV